MILFQPDQTDIAGTGSSIKYVLITESVVARKSAPLYLARGQAHKFYAMIAAEEEEWDTRLNEKKAASAPLSSPGERSKGAGSFEEYREKSRIAGAG